MSTIRVPASFTALILASVAAAACGDVANPGEEAEGQIPGCVWADTNQFEVDHSESSEGGTVTFACLDGSLPVDAADQVDCAVFTFTPPQADGACRCDSANGRQEIAAAHRTALRHVQASFPGGDAGLCACELRQATGPGLAVCQTSPRPDDLLPLDAFCYVDLASTPPVGSSESAEGCDSRAMLMLATEPQPIHGELMALACGTPQCLGQGGKR